MSNFRLECSFLVAPPEKWLDLSVVSDIWRVYLAKKTIQTANKVHHHQHHYPPPLLLLSSSSPPILSNIIIRTIFDGKLCCVSWWRYKVKNSFWKVGKMFLPSRRRKTLQTFIAIQHTSQYNAIQALSIQLESLQNELCSMHACSIHSQHKHSNSQCKLNSPPPHHICLHLCLHLVQYLLPASSRNRPF